MKSGQQFRLQGQPPVYLAGNPKTQRKADSGCMGCGQQYSNDRSLFCDECRKLYKDDDNSNNMFHD
ncbi:hypothetical protein D3C87_280170 [compost metagenome]